MAPRANWKGYLRLSLVSCPIALFPASTSSEKVHFHRLNAKTGNRIKLQNIDAETGEVVPKEDLRRGYEIKKGRNIEIEPEELEAIRIESKRLIDINEFVPRGEIDELYVDAPYYLVPDGDIGQEAFAVIREVIRDMDMIAIGRIVLSTREHIIGLEARGQGLLGTTLRYPYEVRQDDAYFAEIPDVKIPADALELAKHIVETKRGHFHPEKFEDRYETALKELIKRKAKGEPITPEPEEKPDNVIDLMEALKRSLAGERRGGKSDEPVPKASKKKAPARPRAAAKRRAG